MEQTIREITTRRKTFTGKKYYITTNSFKEGEKWFNCLYLHFCKEDFPDLVYPKIVETELKHWPKRFAYERSDVASLGWHCGCTFYEETFIVESGRTYVKVGCDYRHLYDDRYMENDHGLDIINSDGKLIAEEFEQLALRKLKVE